MEAATSGALGGAVGPAGELSLKHTKKYPSELGLRAIHEWGMPRLGLERDVNRWRRSNQRNLWRRARKVLVAQKLGLPHFYGALYFRLNKADGISVDFGLASMAVVTTEGAETIVDSFQGTTDVDLFHFHGFGTGSTAENVADAALETELTTEYSTDNVRPTGSQTEDTSVIFRTVGTLDPDSNVAITEHGILTTAAVATDVMLDRSVFSVINVDAGGDTLQATYDLTIAAGS